jgi:hypothetical protein
VATLTERGAAYAEARYSKRRIHLAAELARLAQEEVQTPATYGEPLSIYKEGQPVGRSRNLRGLIDYARRSSVSRVSIRPLAKGEGLLRVVYADGAYSYARFASFTVLKDWTRSRRSWPVATVLPLRS